MADYVRSIEGREAIECGLSDIQRGPTIGGKDTLAAELKHSAAKFTVSVKVATKRRLENLAKIEQFTHDTSTN
jgi:hypothetical protein